MSRFSMPVTATQKSSRRALALGTSSIISFSLTLLAGSIAVLAGMVPLQSMSFGERIDIGAMLFVLPVLALVLSVVFEATLIAMRSPQLPEPRRRAAVRWNPDRRRG
jgi:hypothetical protein